MSKTCLKCGKTFEEIIEDPAMLKSPCMLDMLEGVDNLCCHGHERDEAGYVIAGTQKGPKYERAFFGLKRALAK